MKNECLINEAIKVMSYSYSSYSNFKVGAALLTESGKIYTGCNIENASFSATNCAERTAFFKAISEGERNFEKIAIVGGLNGIVSDYTPPCGICRQVMSEFCKPDFKIILAKSENEYIEYKLSEILPLSFSSVNLETNHG